MAYGAVDYHLRRLEQRGLIRGEPSEQLKVFFTTEFPREDRALAAAIRGDPVRRIVVALLSLKELTHGDLSNATGLGLSTVSHHAKRLVRKGIVVARDEGRRTFFTLADPARAERILIRHGHSIGDGALDAYITVWSEWRRPRAPKEEPGPPPPSSP